MSSAIATLRTWLWPPVPAAVSGDLTLLRYASLRAQVPMLYVLLVLLILVTLYGTPMPVDSLVAWGAPVAMITIISVRILIWFGRRNAVVTIASAERMIRVMAVSSGCICILASTWCVYGWLNAPDNIALYYPLIMAMGALSASFCVANIRFQTICNLALCLTPISFALLVSTDPLNQAVGGSIVVASLFLARLVHHQHGRIIAQLLLERQMLNLAHTDELTGLLNRRALMAQVEQAISDQANCALALIDLDGFKQVNDRYGHGVGDALLVEVARRMQGPCDDLIHIARIGGDEFALFMPVGDQAALRLAVDQVLAMLAAPIAIDGVSISIGASAGLATATGGSIGLAALFAEADRRLYRAKAIGREARTNNKARAA
jgi:diguanylate cyclase